MAQIFRFEAAYARKMARISQEELAEKLNVVPATISRYERGRRTIHPETAVEMAKAVGDDGLLSVYCKACPVLKALNKKRSA